MLRFLRRFFEPVLYSKWVTFKMTLEAILGGLWYDLIPIFSLPYLTVLITEKRIYELQIFTLCIVILYSILWIIGFYIRKWDLEAKYIYQKYINENHRIKTILKDNLHIERMGTGKVQSIIQKGIFSWANLNWQLTYQFPRAIIILGSGIYVTYSLGIFFVILFLILLIISLSGYIFYKRKFLKFEDELQEEENNFNDNSVRIIMSRAEVTHSGKGEYEIKKLSHILDKMRNVSSNGAKYDFIADLFISGNGILLPFIGVLVMVMLSGDYSYDIGVITAFMYFTVRFSGMLYHISYMFNIAIDEYPKIKKFWDFLDNIPNLKNYDEGKIFKFGNGEIDFKNVNFEYKESDKLKVLENKREEELTEEEKEEKADRRTVLENLNLKINGGEKVAFIGRSGSGKTTIVKLISGYMQPTSGKVFIDNQDLGNLSLKSYYKYLGYLTQEPSVFDGSIKENMLYAIADNRKIADAEIVEALEKAQCDFVFKMKKGINSQVGEKGVRLSGGERQRLAIAKLFLKNPEIIILDEPTSALDSFSEELVTKALNELFVGRTVIVIAHRLQTVRNADRIIVLENGKIVEDGNHEQLVNLQGNYYKMLNMQSGV